MNPLGTSTLTVTPSTALAPPLVTVMVTGAAVPWATCRGPLEPSEVATRRLPSVEGEPHADINPPARTTNGSPTANPRTEARFSEFLRRDSNWPAAA